jgi:hypothetical protein
MKVFTPDSVAARSRLRLPATLIAMTPMGSSGMTIGPDTPPA